MQDKLKAFLCHLSISICIALIVIFIIFQVWYPFPIADAVGVKKITYMLLAIDVIIGPLLTFIIYDKAKTSLKFDLLVIAILQCTALVYGVWTVSKARPIAIVQSYTLFQLVTPKDLMSSPHDNVSWFGPKWIATEDQQARKNVIFDPAFYPKYYMPLSQAKPRMAKNANVLENLNTFNSEQRVQQVLNKYPTATTWMPLRTSGLGLVVLLDQQQNVVATVDLRPWQE